jgi:type VI secretion system secreted protein VgrG
MDDLIKLTSSVFPGTCRVIAFRGTEAISSPYQYEIFVTSSGGAGEQIDLGDAIGAKATLTIDRATGRIPPFHFSGVLAAVELLHEMDGFSLFRAVLVPRLWLLSLSKHSRVFTRMALPDIVESVLTENGFNSDDFELRLGTYDEEEHVCQYGESDLDFLSRWMEREGICYFFEHGEWGEKIIFCDDMTHEADPLGEPVPYHPQLGEDRSAGASFRTFTCKHNALPARVLFRDYDYSRPNLRIAGAAEVADAGAGDVSLHGARFFSPAAGERLANIRAEELRAREVVFQASGNRAHLRAGYTFELEGHSRSALNAKYLTIEARHSGNQRAGGQDAFRDFFQMEHDDVYRVDVTAIPAQTQFRPAICVPWPRIYGLENGTVDGPADSEYAQIDDQGRYKVRFKFDESGLKDGNASTFVRMMQPHGGSIEGFHFPLRRGTEVVVSFLGGDPDRPVITGVVPNALTPSAVTSSNHTKNVIQTGGRNRFELEDKAGQQHVALSTPYSKTQIRMGAPDEAHELVMSTDGNTQLDTGKNYDLIVGQNGGGCWNASIKDSWYTYVQSGDHALYVQAGTSRTEVKGDTWLHVTGGGYMIDVDAGSMTTNVHDSSTTNVSGAAYTVNVLSGSTTVDTFGTTNIKSKGKLTLSTEDASDYSVASDMLFKVGGALTESVEGAHSITTGARTETVKGDYKQTITGSFAQTTASSSNFWSAAKNSRTLGAAYSLNVGAKASLDVSASSTMGLSAVVALSAGIKLEAKVGGSLSMTAGCDIDVGSVKFDQKTLKFASAGCGIKNVGAVIQQAGICIFS